MARRVLGDERTSRVARTPRRVLGVHIDDTTASETISRDAPSSLGFADEDDTEASKPATWFARYYRHERDSTQDALGEVIADWVPGGEVTAITLKVQKTTQARDEGWANSRVWIAEFDPGDVFVTDMLVNNEGQKFTVQAVTPVIDGDAVVAEKALLSERV